MFSQSAKARNLLRTKIEAEKKRDNFVDPFLLECIAPMEKSRCSCRSAKCFDQSLFQGYDLKRDMWLRRDETCSMRDDFPYLASRLLFLGSFIMSEPCHSPLRRFKDPRDSDKRAAFRITIYTTVILGALTAVGIIVGNVVKK